MHDIALRGKESSSGNVQSLYAFRIEAGDELLRQHLESSPANARYTSVRIEHELIKICESTIREEIVAKVKQAPGFAIIADESADISGHEQLSLGVRFIDMNSSNTIICEEFLGFARLTALDAASIANTILEHCSKFGLNLEKLYGQAYDGCSTMAGKENGVQSKIRSKFPKAAFVHCAAHKLNLVVHDSNAVPDIRNTTGTVKAIIKYFRDSPKRRNMIPNVPLLSETRWTAKYKSIRVFSSSFVDIFEQLHVLATTAAGKTRQDAYQLQCASSTGNFVVSLIIISTYSAMLEPVTQALQAVELDILAVSGHVQNLLAIFRSHRTDAANHFKIIFEKAEDLAKSIGTELLIPRQCGRQVHRANVDSCNTEEYFRRTIFVPYLDSLISSLDNRFGEQNRVNFSLFALCPAQMSKMNRLDFATHIMEVNKVYEIENLNTEALTWFDMWSNKNIAKNTENVLKDGLAGLLTYTDLFPAVREALLIALTLPVTTCTVERSFSTMRRVKTWLRSTMTDGQLSGLCMMSVHRAKILEQKSELIEKVINHFAQDERRVQLLFK
ncbi:52 kDa repressor of the inhibitor of the protein kinase-like [Hyperolius riggenbachi]|uniref:52 kDa repressor of the inhibitor of the protein kinase-like n=1 Tax=Hyperolius riggenbachi TaxID=752182 RepID=UPI0035A2BAD9